jgi:crotonobetainyl-CoA:carnitine CoA-transferase CaiB-like acyl-CoA transferase
MKLLNFRLPRERPGRTTSHPVRTIGLPGKFSDTPGEVPRGAPLYGQHNREVLREHGFGDDEIDDVLAERAVAES